jgi:hypothetical protein
MRSGYRGDPAMQNHNCHVIKKASNFISGGLPCLFEHNFEALLIYALAQAPHQIAKVLWYEPIPRSEDLVRLPPPELVGAFDFLVVGTDE